MVRLRAPIVLASASPRRRELLAHIGIEVQVAPVAIDERPLSGEPADQYAPRVAEAKLEAALRREASTAGPAPFVLAADTTVLLDGAIFGKPRDDADASEMLRALLGRSHQVVTAVAVGRVGEGLLAAESVATTVVMRAPADVSELTRYVALGEGRDKAGAYAVQGVASGFVTSIVGSYSNVVGLPVAETLGLLRRVGAVKAWP
ncbi:MAG: septum formation protein Maf [Myxococcales bacterium]|nr:septum formation protein Maf [Myxococcales bacterium]